MQVYSADESGTGIVCKPGKVLEEAGRRNVYRITSAKRGKTHTLGSSLPPLMVFPQKRNHPDSKKLGAPSNSLFMVSDSGWINNDIYLAWLCHFIQWILPAIPVLLT